MAKISANGASEVRRYKAADGYELLLRSDGAILCKLVKGGGWTVAHPKSRRLDLKYAEGVFDIMVGRHEKAERAAQICTVAPEQGYRADDEHNARMTWAREGVR